jgi:hypothetical protein
MPVAGRMNKQQITVGQPDRTTRPANKITEAGKRIGTVVVVTGDSDSGLL